MRALDTIAESIRTGYAHPTTLLNTFIQVENEGGLGAVRRIERQLHLSVQGMRDRQHPHSDLAQTWLNSARAYLITSAQRRQAV
ncbi:hypothetical protein LAJ19_00215 [Deinococcus taeanensis]|uniref:hypothetical protein n=1 Tax=Deinococcus taeanensis TaxID=2737050 RepID=UPI001CDC51F8|nr:hypothetical protein [Deinococcus taeanensis]UBV42706.1 hypothetical protein LAJ19_00215 [Deinococcus taeanensis]